MHFHALTAHSSEFDRDFDLKNTELPKSFYPNKNFGPLAHDFTPHEPQNVIQMLLNCKRFPTSGRIQRIPPPLKPKYGFFGDFRGIPWLNNSCFMDVFFMLIAFSSAFDVIFTQEALDASVLLQIILYDLVIPLRTRMSVSRDVIAMIRQLMFEETQNSDYLNSIFDIEEFMKDISLLVRSFSSGCNFVNSSNTSGLIVCPMVISIVYHQKGFHSCLQDAILYSLRMNETTIIELPEFFFVRVLPDTSAEQRLVLPQTVVNLRTKTYLLEGDVEEKRKESSYSLTAIILLEGAHYRALLELPNGEWSLFNSMHGFDNGHCIPTITYVPGFRQYLESGCRAEYLCSKSDARPNGSRTDYHRLVTKCSYAYVFSKSVQSGEAFCRSDCAATASETTGVLLPDIDKSLLTDLSLVHRFPPSFGYTQTDCMSSKMTSPEHFYVPYKHSISRDHSEQAFCRKDCAATVSEPTRVLLPDINETLFQDLQKVHCFPHSFGHTQPHCMPSLIKYPEDFYEMCKHVISRECFPNRITVKTRFDRIYFCMFFQNLFSSIVFPEFSVNYRIISFSMENGTIVSYHGNIDNLSKGKEKQFFYEQLEREISRQNVISVVIVKIH
jgi:hypothetical protein